MMLTTGKSLRFVRNQDGGGTVFGLYIFIVLAMVMGLALDATNGWRNRTFLGAAADVGAHAGAVAYSNGLTGNAVVGEVQRVVEANLPASLWGNVLISTSDVALAHYDPQTNAFTGFNTGNDNAVVVRVARDTARGNPVATYLMNFLGVDRMHVVATSAAVYDETGICEGTDGIYAHGQITLTSQNDVGDGFCIHSEDFVWLPQQNTFGNNTLVSMPDLDDCNNKCTDSANPGINATEMHMVLPHFATYISDHYQAFLDPVGSSGVKYEFFTDDPLDSDDANVQLGNLSPLLAITGATTYSIGDVVSLTHAQFHSLNELPSGLVYEVLCTANGNVPNTRLTFDNSTGKMEDAVLLTNCSLEFDSGTDIEGSVLITSRIASSATVGAGSGTTVGDASASCKDEDRSVIMSASDIQVPADFAASNITLVTAGDVNIAASSSSSTSHSKGMSIYADGEVHIAASHTFQICGDDTDVLNPEGMVIRLVIPIALPT